MQKDYIGTEKCGSDTPKNTGETLYLGSTSSESFKRERWVKLRCLYNSRGRCFIPCYYTFFYHIFINIAWYLTDFSNNI